MHVRFVETIVPEDWNRLVDADMPFLQHAFLSALERSGSVTAETGWSPLHAVVYKEGRLVAAAPGYLKSHSYGEYVFDWAWADAYARYGLAYYPKYVTAIPFTPVCGPRLLIDPLHQNNAKELARVRAVFAEGVEAECHRRGVSSWHVLFEHGQPPRPDMLQRMGTQFHWANRGYTCFEDFLAGLSSSRRKSMRKERKRLTGIGLTYRWRSGQELKPDERKAFYACYATTYFKRGQQPYLRPAFFELIWQHMPAATQVLLVEKEQEIVAAALFFVGTQSLYGRYWGALQEIPGLHFEACYYQGIDRCIALGLQRFDAGAQGEHKLLRGFEPVTTSSYHWIASAEFEAAIADFVTREAEHVSAYQEQACDYLPYRKDQ
ncbi:MAG: GNAT family N-acetyltransferase [Oleiphilaceae bacterium]|nr:GNAT family N-acetyltransferase [Oleiphilaceae bacterium]